MKILLSLLLVFLPVSIGFAHSEIPQVSVYGGAAKEVVPDEIRWVLSVRTEGGTTSEVSKEHVREVTTVLSVLEELGQAKEGVTTTNMQLNEHWVYRNNSREKQGYFASTTIRFVSSDFDEYVDYWTRLAAVETVSVSSVVFSVSKRKEIEDEVKVLAIENARKKAQKFAAALGAEIKEPLMIEELGEDTFFPARPARAALMDSGGGGQPVSPGKQRIQAQVKVVFSLK